MLFQMRFRMLSTLLLSLIVPAGSASADMRFNFENCYNFHRVTKKQKLQRLSQSERICPSVRSWRYFPIRYLQQ